MTEGTYRFLALAWAVFVASALVLPGDALPMVPDWIPESVLPLLDKAVHAGLFFVLHLLLVGAARRKARGHGIQLALLGLFYSLALELAQLLVPGRAWEGMDLLASLVGIGLAMVLVEVVGRLRSSRRPSRA